MGIVPDFRLGKVQFYEAHIAPWTANAAAIGLLPAAVTTLNDRTKAARAAFDAAEAARQAAKTATQAFYDAVRAMHSGPGAGQDMIDAIRNRAQTTGDPKVYTLAQIPPPATPGITPPPGTPTDFTVGLLQTGAIELKWKCANPTGTSGTVYEVKRRVGGGGGGSGSFNYVGSSGVRTFVDETVPLGSASVTYQVTAIRSTRSGNPAQFTVSFGTVGGAGGPPMITAVSDGASIKMAA